MCCFTSNKIRFTIYIGTQFYTSTGSLYSHVNMASTLKCNEFDVISP